jgi:hypothetical protein
MGTAADTFQHRIFSGALVYDLNADYSAWILFAPDKHTPKIPKIIWDTQNGVPKFTMCLLSNN